ncbi:unnamed protein product, partial [Owenia fusiformis]
MSTNFVDDCLANQGPIQKNIKGQANCKRCTKRGTRGAEEMSSDIVTNPGSKGHTDDHGHPPGVRGEERHAVQFVEKVDPNIECCECGHVLQEGIQTACGHRVCEKHINDSLEKGEIYTCQGGDPDCVEVNEKNRHNLIYPDYVARKVILTLHVYCLNREYGCSEETPLKSLQKHLAKCDFRKIQCKNEGCNEFICSKELEEHMTQECDFRIEICPKCNDPTPHARISEHLLKQCREELIKCPYKCGSEFKRKEQESHEKYCTSKPTTCELKTLGCGFKGSQEDVKKHESLSNIEHLGMFSKKLEKQSVESNTLERQIEEMKNEKEIYKKEMKD